jgi:hypothetical protein
VINFATNKYDLKRAREWVLLAMEFAVPEGNGVTATLAVEKGIKSEALAGVIYIDDVKLELQND